MTSTGELLQRVTADDDNDACVGGVKVWVLLAQLATGVAAEDLLVHRYPQLEMDDVWACYAYAVELVRRS